MTAALFTLLLPMLLPGGAEIWIVLLIALLLFGNRIPGVARNLGSGIVEFKKGLKGDEQGSAKDGAESSGADTPSKSTKQDA